MKLVGIVVSKLFIVLRTLNCLHILIYWKFWCSSLEFISSWVHLFHVEWLILILITIACCWLVGFISSRFVSSLILHFILQLILHDWALFVLTWITRTVQCTIVCSWHTLMRLILHLHVLIWWKASVWQRHENRLLKWIVLVPVSCRVLHAHQYWVSVSHTVVHFLDIIKRGLSIRVIVTGILLPTCIPSCTSWWYSCFVIIIKIRFLIFHFWYW